MSPVRRAGEKRCGGNSLWSLAVNSSTGWSYRSQTGSPGKSASVLGSSVWSERSLPVPGSCQNRLEKRVWSVEPLIYLSYWPHKSHQTRFYQIIKYLNSSGTTAHVGISLYGLNKSGSRHLQSEGAFQRNSLDDFQIETDANLGEIWKIRIWHDNTGQWLWTASFFLLKILTNNCCVFQV